MFCDIPLENRDHADDNPLNGRNGTDADSGFIMDDPRMACRDVAARRISTSLASRESRGHTRSQHSQIAPKKLPNCPISVFGHLRNFLSGTYVTYSEKLPNCPNSMFRKLAQRKDFQRFGDSPFMFYKQVQQHGVLLLI